VQENIYIVDSDDKIKAALDNARQVLLSGGIVAFPTESFYGLAGDIENAGAIEKLFALKKRDKNNPVLILAGRPDHAF
jgi:L-threonylcarbamoyladenylate synthase